MEESRTTIPQKSREKLTDAQLKALPLLMAPISNAAVADAVGVNASTLYSWMKEQEFSARLNSMRKEAFDEAFGKVKSATTKAVDKLVEMLDSDDQGLVFRVAGKIIDTALKAKELGEIEERIRALEEAAKGANWR